FGVGGREYQILVEWIRAGAPGPNPSDPSVTKIEVRPGNKVLKPDQEQQLSVDAHYSDGQTREVTWLTKFDSNDPGAADVDSSGTVRVRRNGETSVRVAYQGQVAVVLVTAPFEQQVDPAKYKPRNNYIDDCVNRKLAALHIEPSDLSTDGEFIRRAYLDTIGVLPTAEEVRAFLADTRADKRAKLIDALLQRPAVVDHWS